MTDLTIVITTYNRCDILRRLLLDLENQTDRDFEVVVAVDGATDRTMDMLATLQTSYRLRWVDTRYPGYGLAIARNMGILMAEGRAVVIIDDDCFPRPEFVAAHRRSARSGVITGGLRTPAESDNAYMDWKMAHLAELPDCEPIAFDRLRREWPNAYITECNMCMLREDFIRIGLFSERMKIYGFIGQEFFARARHFGFRYQFNHAASIVHHGHSPGNDAAARRRKRRHARIAALLNPSLMTPRQFAAQAAWAAARAEGRTLRQPPFLPDAMLKMPGRALLAVGQAAKRAIYPHLRQDGMLLSGYRRFFKKRTPD